VRGFATTQSNKHKNTEVWATPAKPSITVSQPLKPKHVLETQAERKISENEEDETEHKVPFKVKWEEKWKIRYCREMTTDSVASEKLVKYKVVQI
jgi:hypothetical protein